MTRRRILLILALLASQTCRSSAAEPTSVAASAPGTSSSDSLAAIVENLPAPTPPLVTPPVAAAMPAAVMANPATPGGAPLLATASQNAAVSAEKSKDSLENPPAPSLPQESSSLIKPLDQAAGIALLPSRPESESMRFDNVAAAEVVLRFAREYRASIVFSGDGSLPITGWVEKGKSVDTMLRAIFPENTWIITSNATSVLVTQRPKLTFRKITENELNPPLSSL